MYTGEVPGVISLVYDSLAASELDWVLPDLREAGIRATFFGDGELFTSDVARWKQAVADGHDLGNGALLALHVLKDRMDGTALLEEVEELQLLIAEISADSAIAPLAIVNDEGAMSGVKIGQEREFPVMAVTDANQIDSSGDGIICLTRPHPQLHQAVLKWLSSRREDVVLLSAIGA